MKFKIFNSELSVNQAVTIIQGKYEPENLSNLQNSLQNWEEMNTENYFSASEFIPNLLQKISKISTQNDQKLLNFGEIWEHNRDLYENFNKLYKNAINLHKLNHFLIEKQRIENELIKLDEYEQNILEYSNDQLFITKSEHLQKLEADLKIFEPKFNLSREEFDSKQNQMNQLHQTKEVLGNQMKELRESQRLLFRETNDLTSKLDGFDDQIQTYQEKLDDLDPIKDKADYDRISHKLDPIKSEYDLFKARKQQLMTKSKTLKDSMGTIEQKLNETSRKIQSLDDGFKTEQKIFQELKTKHDNIVGQIISLQSELNALILKRENENMTASPNPSNQIQIPYSSIMQIHQEQAKCRANLKLINDKMAKIFATTDSTALFASISEKITLLKQKVQEATQSYASLNDNNQNILQYIGILKEIQEYISIMNILCDEIGLKLESKFIFEKDTENQFSLSLAFMQGKKIINPDITLKRVEKGILGASHIIACYIVANKPIIPLYIDYLPSFLTTKQTFSKVIKYLGDRLGQLKQILPKDYFDSLKLMFFVKKENYEVENIPVITINE